LTAPTDDRLAAPLDYLPTGKHAALHGELTPVTPSFSWAHLRETLHTFEFARTAYNSLRVPFKIEAAQNFVPSRLAVGITTVDQL
jgi:hypothetical protein